MPPPPLNTHSIRSGLSFYGLARKSFVEVYLHLTFSHTICNKVLQKITMGSSFTCQLIFCLWCDSFGLDLCFYLWNTGLETRFSKSVMKFWPSPPHTGENSVIKTIHHKFTHSLLSYWGTAPLTIVWGWWLNPWPLDLMIQWPIRPQDHSALLL